MLLPGLTNSEAGAIGESFVKYKLERWGEVVVRPNADLPFDLVVLREHPIKIQVKTRRAIDGYSYKFQTTHSTASIPYTAGQFDILAVVALDIEQVQFRLHTPQKTLNVHPVDFGDGEDIRTWYEKLDFLGLS